MLNPKVISHTSKPHAEPQNTTWQDRVMDLMKTLSPYKIYFIRSFESKVADQFIHLYDRLSKLRLGSRL